MRQLNTILDRSGRVVIPKPARERLHLAPGDVLEVQVTADGLQLRPTREEPGLGQEPVLAWEDGILVFNGSWSAEADDLLGQDREARLGELAQRAGL